MLCLVLLGNTVDNIEEVSLQTRTADESTINVRLAKKVFRVGSLHRSTVLDADGVRNFDRNIVLHPGTDIGMCLLSHLRCSCEACTDRPDWFVSNRDVGPVTCLKDFRQRFKLFGTYVHGRSCLTFFLLFTDSEHDLEAGTECDLALFSTKCFGFSGHTESFTTFGVADDDPRTTNVLELVCTDLTRERTVLGVVSTVLCPDLDVITEHTQRHGDVDVRDTQDDVDVGRDGSGIVKDLDPFDVFVIQPVTFPVPTNQVPAGSSNRIVSRRSLRAVCLQSFFRCHCVS
mmetsp:Transcript_49138/g.119080  ORF Transcript_49138/g.119080 Transcript_49138/m.119080 type:complete len:287 (-) Transcript_49138:11-871(-)